LKIKLKKEIISFRQPDAAPLERRAPSIDPIAFKAWLDEKRDITLLDTRNDYEIELGTFKGAVNLHLNDFCEFAEAAAAIDHSKPIVMFCTGGVRCEKAALHMMNLGYQDVYQLDGGILNYFEKVGAAHYDGGCFVFDERVLVDAAMKVVGV
jgi:predicted sulfurtransferase